MIIIKDRTEENARKIVEQHREDNYRCGYIPSYMMLNRDNSMLEKTCESFFQSNECYMVLDDNSDMFLFGKNLTHRNFTKFRDTICWPDGETGKTLFMDVKRDSARILQIIEQKKIAKQKAAAEEAALLQQEERRKKTEIIVNAPVDQRLLKTLKERRNGRERVSVLLVEDEPFTRQLVGAALGTHISYFAASTGEEVIPAYLNEAPDVVFLDICLPDVNGQQILKKLISIDPDAYVVMLSGLGNQENVVKAAASGARGFISKPFTRDKLFQYINSCEKQTSRH